ncbi:MAG: class I SAM-dependent methyltransferase [Elusimicrobia bacterium]|nr:class I SAM-dependent methyltransferase [Elusimicrobiota bacterium]
MTNDFTGVTEAPGINVSNEALRMVYHRYQTSGLYCQGKDVLEVACGAGMGLGYLARKAKSLVGADYTDYLIKQARGHYAGRLPLLRLDAALLPFKEGAFDVVVCCEAIYYFPNAARFLEECRRVLRPGGAVLISTVNREWSAFNPSSLSTKYYSSAELKVLLQDNGFRAEIYGAFPTQNSSRKDAAVSLIKRAAVSLGVIPKTMKGKEWLKRFFLGKLTMLPAELNGGEPAYVKPIFLDASAPIGSYKIIYAVGWH